MDSTKQSSYRSIMKATSLFGGVQVYQILINVVKAKFIAVLLGPYGVGIQGLYVSAIDLIKQISSMGLSQSAVRDVSEANNSGEKYRVSLIISVVKKLVWITGFLGLIATAILSPFLSKLAFGNYDYTIPFIILSVTLLLEQLSAGQKVVLQGLRKLKDLAKASALGSTTGLLVSVPLYYWLGIKGIVPTLLLNSFAVLSLSWYYARKVDMPKVRVNVNQVRQEGSLMLKLGLALCLSSILLSVSSFVLRGFIRQMGGAESVGLFTAGYTVINTYVAMIFNAMGTDFYPRLAAVNNDDEKCTDMINQQSEIGILILGPLLIIFLIFMPLMIKLLYSEEFLVAGDYLSYACLGMLLKMTSWCISYVFIAKSASRIFVINEILQNSYTLMINLLGYYFMGLKGLGISFAICQLIYLIQVFLIASKKYHFSFANGFIKLFVLQSALLTLSLSFMLVIGGALGYVGALISFGLSGYISFKGMNERMNLSHIFNRYNK